MPAKHMHLTAISLLLPLFMGASQVVQAAELSTLFTTPQERQIINANRYKRDDGTIQQPVEDETTPEPVQQLVREEVTREYAVSGITVSSDGPNTVWINSLVYEDGEQLDDRSMVKVLVGDEIRVRITTPDGRNHLAKSGETISVTYLAPAKGS